MKKLPLLLLFFAVFATAQTNRFIYEYRYIPNINEKDTVRTELMALDITPKGSTYQSLAKIQQDSVFAADFQKMVAGGSIGQSIKARRMGGRSIRYSVEKEYPDFQIFLKDNLGGDHFKILENEKQNWTVLPDTQTFGAYKAQKATTTWGGRRWTAWFSTEIPFADGPYKFAGLPGLIVKVEDGTGSHSMLLKANKTVPSAAEQQNEVRNGNMSFRFGSQEISVTEEQFKKAWKDYINDPAKSMRQHMGGSGDGNVRVFRMQGADGREISDPAEIARRIEKGIKEALAKDNNKIEPSLYELK